MTILQKAKQKTDDQTAALSTLAGKASSLQSSLSSLESAFGANALSASSSNSSAASATASVGAQSGSWSVGISSLGATTAFVVTGFPPVTDPNASGYLTGQTQTLILDTDPTDGNPAPEIVTLSPPGTSLQSLAGEINKKLGTRVQATIVNVGTTATPNYQLSLQSKTLGAMDITLTDGSLSSTNNAAQRGAMAKYTVNGAQVSTDSRTVTLAPGITMDMKATTTDPFTVDVKSDSTSLKNALQQFVNAYNAVTAELDKSHGDSSAPLAGNSSVSAVQDTLRSLMADVATGSKFSSLAQLGLSFDKHGILSIDSTIFSDAMDNGGLDEAQKLISPSGDTGWLKRAKGLMDSLVLPASGLLSSAVQSSQDLANSQQDSINAQQDRIDDLQKSLEARMAAADATIAMMEQQVSYFTNMFAAMKSNQDSMS